MSIAMALYTIPMPSDVHEIYPFASKAIGSFGSCEAQGFLVETAMIFVLLSNTTLHLYYVCTIRYGMTEVTFKRRIMPVTLTLCLACVLLPLTALQLDFINPSPLTGVCMVSPYPFGCGTKPIDNPNGEEDPSTRIMECIRGDSIFFLSLYSILSSIVIGGVFAVMLISLVLVIVSVFNTELSSRKSRRIQRTSRLLARAQDHQDQPKMHDFENTRAMTTQALMYIIAFLLTYACLFIVMAQYPTYLAFGTAPSKMLSFLTVFFQPLQGFFNAVIFIYHKMHILRRTNAALSFFEAFKHVIVSPSKVPQQVISSIEIAIDEIGVRRSEENTRKQRGMSSISLREREMARQGTGGLRRFGVVDSNNLSGKGGGAPSSYSIDSGGGEDGHSSSHSQSSRSSLGNIPGTDYYNDEEDGLASTTDSCRKYGSIPSNFSPNEEDFSSASSLNTLVNMPKWNADSCKEEEGGTVEGFEMN